MHEVKYYFITPYHKNFMVSYNKQEISSIHEATFLQSG